jgi:hypothetical protein
MAEFDQVVNPFEEDQGFSGKVREVVKELLKEPALLPDEWKAWLKLYLEQVGLQIPISQVTGNFLTETTTTQLGGNIHGRTGTVRGGANPYEFVQMVYDAVYGKWVSNPQSWIILGSGGVSDTQTAYDVLGTTGVDAPMIPYQAFYDADLRPQWRLIVFMDNSGANSTFAKLGYQTVDAVGATSSVVESSWELENVGTTAAFKDSGWQNMNEAVTVDVLLFAALVGKVSAGTGAWGFASIYQRWVSA